MRTGLTFDPRTKLCVILFASFSLMVPLSFIYECLFMTILFILFLVIGEWKKRYRILFRVLVIGRVGLLDVSARESSDFWAIIFCFDW